MRYTLLLCSFVLTLGIQAQSSDYLFIQGQVTNAKTGAPLPYAHVGIPERSIGTTTGYDGAFTLKVPAYYRGSMLTVSYLGFANYKSPVDQLGNPVNIRLQPIATTLQEVVVMDESKIEDIIRRAVARIPDNYPDRPTNMTAFYRESRTDGDQEYVYLAEGVLQLYKTSYTNDKEGQVGLLQGRQVALSPDDVFSQKSNFSSGHLAADRFDFVKNREDFIDERYFDAYQYWIENLTAQDGRPVYVIGFDRADQDERARMKGKVYIDTASFAFVRADFEILPDAQKKRDDYPLYFGRWLSNRYAVNYRQGDGYWHLSDALREGMWRDSGVYTNEIIITEAIPGRGKPIPYVARLDRDDRFLDITGVYDPSFWANYNTAPINDPKLAARMEAFQNQDKAEQVFDTAHIAQLKRPQDSIRFVEPQSKKPLRTPGGYVVTSSESFPLDFYFSYGAGVHALRSEAARFRVGYLAESDDPSSMLFVENDLATQEFEPIYQIALDIRYKQWLLRWNLGRDLWTNIYRESAIGLGGEFNLNKKRRPVFVRPLAQYSRLFYGRRIGRADNDYGRFEVDDKKFRADKVRMFYGERQQQLKLTLELAVELNPSREFFVRMGYHLPFNNQSRLYLRESGRVFNRDARIPLSSATVVNRNGEPYTGTMSVDEPSFSLTVGILMK